MGWAVVLLTIGLRLVLLPLSIVSQRNEFDRERAEADAAVAARAFKNDPVAQKEEYRRIMRRHRLSPWAKVIVLGVQGLVLILLYQVFMGGIFGERLIKTLYAGIGFPGLINNDFYGQNLSHTHDVLWPMIAAAYLFVSILIQKGKRTGWEKSEVVFLFLFPLFTFTALWILPMVKSLFILTSMCFSDILTLIRRIFFPVKTPVAAVKPVGK